MKKWLLFCFLMAPTCSFCHAADMPEWLERWTFKGDLRLRLEGLEYNDENRKNRNRARFRLRLSADAKLTDNLRFHMRLASGTGEPTSTNQTFDNSFSGKDILIDQAQVTYKSGDWLMGGGKIKNPLHHTDLIWDSDVNPEGFSQNFSGAGFYVTLAEFFLEENKVGEDLSVYIGQLGHKGGDAVKYNVSAAYYSYKGLEAADEYRFLDLLATLKFTAGDTPVSLKFDYISNNSDFAPGFSNEDDTAWGLFAKVGSGKQPGQWTGGLKYAEVEAFSSYILLADADFGFGDRKGFVVNGTYKSSKYLVWSLGYYNVKGIHNEDLGNHHIQLDAIILF